MNALWYVTIALATLSTPSSAEAEGERSFKPGTRVRVSAVAEEGWVFVRWEGSFTSQANPLEITIDASTVLRPVFQKKGEARTGEEPPKDSVSLEVASVPGGTVDIAVVDAVAKAEDSIVGTGVDLLSGDPGDRAARPRELSAEPSRDGDRRSRRVRLHPRSAVRNAYLPRERRRLARVQGSWCRPDVQRDPRLERGRIAPSPLRSGRSGPSALPRSAAVLYVGPLGDYPGEPEAIYWDVSDPLRLR